MNRRFALIALTLLALATLACYESGSYRTSPLATPTRRPTATPTLEGLAGAFYQAEIAAAQAEQAMAAATAQAEQQLATVAAVSTLAANAEAELRAGVEATAWAINAQATMQALSIEGTAQAMAMEAARVEATITAQAIYDNATATVDAHRLTATAAAEHDQMTRQAIAYATTITAQADQVTMTSQAVRVAAEATAVQATAAAVQRQNESDEATQVLTTFAGWAVLGLFLVTLGVIGYRLVPLAIPVLIRRWQAIRRRRDEGEIIFVENDGSYTLPLRSATPLLTAGSPPTDPYWQDRATARQQLSNLALAQHAHQGGSRQRVVVARPRQGAPPHPQQPRQPVPGLVGVVSVPSLDDAARRGILPPGLARAIEGEWSQGENEED